MVLVCHSRGLVYLKTRKTAGTSAEMCLERALTGEEVAEQAHAWTDGDITVGHRMIPANRQTDLDRQWYNHMTATEVKAAIGADRFDAALKVACARNPYDMVLSRFHWTEARRKTPPPVTPDEHRRRFEEFLETVDGIASHDVVHDGDTFVPDLLIRFETLSEDLKALCDRLGLPFDPSFLPVTKATRDRRGGLSVADYFTPRTRRFVRDRMGWLFTRAGYDDTLPSESAA